MKREDFNTNEEYLEFRRKANERNRKYYSKPEIKIKKAIYKKIHEQLPHVKEANRKRRNTLHYKSRMKRWREDNPDYFKKYSSTPEYKLMKSKRNKKYRIKKRSIPSFVESEKMRQKKFREEQPDKVKTYKNKYYKSKKGNMNYRYHNQRRITLLKNAKSELTLKNTKKIFNRDKQCVYCGSSLRLEIDHIVPLCKGGNSLMNNLVVACKKCNCSKGSKEVNRWCKITNNRTPAIVEQLLSKQIKV